MLSEWRSSNPSVLKIRTALDIPFENNESSISQRQSIILSLRYYNVRSLLHRQTISNCLDCILDLQCQNVDTLRQFSLGFEVNSMEVALEASIETIKIVRRIGDRLELLGAWWFTLYYIFNAALVLVSCSLHSIHSSYTLYYIKFGHVLVIAKVNSM
ncbi:hypothetical protein V1524DRAFT_174644 [Lipomyces starkeyi]